MSKQLVEQMPVQCHRRFEFWDSGHRWSTSGTHTTPMINSLMAPGWKQKRTRCLKCTTVTKAQTCFTHGTILHPGFGLSWEYIFYGICSTRVVSVPPLVIGSPFLRGSSDVVVKWLISIFQGLAAGSGDQPHSCCCRWMRSCQFPPCILITSCLGTGSIKIVSPQHRVEYFHLCP